MKLETLKAIHTPLLVPALNTLINAGQNYLAIYHSYSNSPNNPNNQPNNINITSMTSLLQACQNILDTVKYDDNHDNGGDKAVEGEGSEIKTNKRNRVIKDISLRSLWGLKSRQTLSSMFGNPFIPDLT